MACCDGCDGECCCQWLGRIPYASTLASILLTAALICYGMWAQETTDGIYDMVTGTGVVADEKADKIKNIVVGIAIIVLVAVTAGFTLMMFIAGWFATDGTRLDLCHRYFRRICCRVWLIMLIVITYLTLMVWILVACSTVVPLILSTLISFYCEGIETFSADTCLDLTQLGLTSEKVDLIGFNSTICGNDFDTFCNVNSGEFGVKTLLFKTWVSSIVVVLGLVISLMALGSNYAHVKDTPDFERTTVYHDNNKGIEMPPWPRPTKTAV